MKKKAAWSVLALSLLILALVLPSNNATAKEKFGLAFLGDLTGGLGFWNAPRLVGIQDAIEYMNKT